MNLFTVKYQTKNYLFLAKSQKWEIALNPFLEQLKKKIFGEVQT